MVGFIHGHLGISGHLPALLAGGHAGQPSERCRIDAQAKDRTDVKPNAQPVQFCHHAVFEARPQKLLRASKDLGADESGHVVYNQPGAGLISNKPGGASASSRW